MTAMTEQKVQQATDACLQAAALCDVAAAIEVDVVLFPPERLRESMRILRQIPAMLRNAEDMSSRLTVAASALENWGRHHPWCASQTLAIEPCTCGLAHAIAAASAFALQPPPPPR